MKKIELFSEYYLNLLNKYNIEVKDELDGKDLYNLLDEIIRTYKLLDYSEDEDAMYDQRILYVLIEKLDEFNMDSE